MKHNRTSSFFAVVAAAMLAACSQTDALSLQSSAAGQDAGVVGFSTYTPRVTRAGAVGEIVTVEELQVDNFGVFAYYTQGNVGYPIAAANTTYKPDFMWNQMVEHDGEKWFYTPIKYWPDKSADGAQVPDRVSFFAYAPYVEANSRGDVSPNSDGITKVVTRNTDSADPILAYTTAKNPLETVDLLWAVLPSFKTKYSTVAGEQDMSAYAGFPNYNLISQTEQEKIMLQFKHALSKLTIDVVGIFDEVPAHGADSAANAAAASGLSKTNVAKNNKIVIEYVKLGTADYALSSQLNLNNYQEANRPNWIKSETDAADTVAFDITGSQLTTLIRYRTPSDPSDGYAEQPRGVTNKPISLLRNDISQQAFFGIIPQLKGDATEAKWSVEVKYHVFTNDSNLAKGYSTFTNVIRKNNIAMTFEPGKHYNLRLRLGMTSVLFEATIDDWIDDSAGTPVDLPINVD